mgnify:CR=1 FL=1|jgi:5-methylcytosine-specific restriction endonuclease McrA
MSNKGGAAKAAYDKAYNARPEQVKKRMERNKARAQYEKTHGDLPSNVDVDHIKPLGAGGSNSASNTRAISQTKNRGWRRGESGYKPKKA